MLLPSSGLKETEQLFVFTQVLFFRSTSEHVTVKRFSSSGPEPGLTAGILPTGTGPECKLGLAPCSLSLSESTNSSSLGTTSHSVINPLSGNVSQMSQSGRRSVRGIKSVCVCVCVCVSSASCYSPASIFSSMFLFLHVLHVLLHLVMLLLHICFFTSPVFMLQGQRSQRSGCS